MTTESSQLPSNRSFLTPREVSELLRVSVHTVRRWIKQGNLPAYRVGHGWRISALALDEWLDQHQSERLSGR